jgi:hypothetical protein
MSAIVNVLGRVGPNEPNNADDVRVVQQLLQMGARGSTIAGLGLPQPTGRFDAATGFWIFYMQNFRQARHAAQVVDGVVSPAHGFGYSPAGGVWTIVLFNFFAKDHSPVEYAAFLANAGNT